MERDRETERESRGGSGELRERGIKQERKGILITQSRCPLQRYSYTYRV